MKILYRILISVTALALLTLTSCLDDEGMGVEVIPFNEVPNVVDFNEAPNSSGFVIRSFEGTTDPLYEQEATFTVNLSSPNVLSKDLQLTVAFDQAAIDAFVADNAGWIGVPPAKQDFTTATITIPAGEREATFSVNFIAEGLSADDLIISAYTITDVSDPDVIISGNFGTQFVKVGVSNIYEGEYTVSIDWIYGGNGSNYGGDYTDWYLITASSIASTMDYFYPYWSYPITITVDVGNPQTIDGHANAFAVTLDVPGKDPGEDIQLDNYLGGVWNYCYQDAGKWVFVLAHQLTTGSGDHVGSGIFTQN